MSRPTQHGPPVGTRSGGTAFSARASPYPAKPAGGYSNHPRSVSREKWNRQFGGAAYLEPGPSNRLVLSLRSLIGSEVDFALERLLPIAGSDPDLLRFSELPGLLDALFAVIEAFLDLRASQPAPAFAAFAHELWPTGAREAARRRATEAALVLRNLALEERNVPHVIAYRRLLGLVVGVLVQREVEGPEGEGCTELSAYLLEVLQLAAAKIKLASPSRQGNGKKAPGVPVAKTKESSPAALLFPLLVALTRSSDRALVLLAYRCLTVLSTNDQNDGVLAYPIYLASQPSPPPHPHPIETAVELLALADGELSVVVLDFIYQHTLVPANAAAFCSSPQTLAVLKLVCSKLHLGAKRETLEVFVPQKGSKAETVQQSAPLRHLRKGAAIDSPTVLSSKLEPEKHAELASVPEPTRAQRWMGHVFEAESESSVTQVVLWTAYRSQFADPATVAAPPILAAADIIKMASEVFPNAAPMVTEDRKFIIKGIRLRDRSNLQGTFMCKWLGCIAAAGPSSAATLYSHINHSHIAQVPPPRSCSWATCTYTPDAALDPSVLVKDLSLHVQTHMPVYHPPPGYPYPGTDKLNMHHAPSPAELLSLRHARYHSEVDAAGEPTGLGLLGSLVLRNVARTVQRSLAGGSIVSGAGNASVQALAEGDSSIFEQFAAAADGAKKREAVQGALENVNFDKVAYARDALLALEQTLVWTSLENDGLGKLLGEVLGVVSECRQQEGKEEEQ